MPIAKDKNQDQNLNMGVSMVKVTMNLPEEDYYLIRYLAAERNTTVSNVFASAIGKQKFFDEEVKKGNKILVKHKCGCWNEVVFR